MRARHPSASRLARALFSGTALAAASAGWGLAARPAFAAAADDQQLVLAGARAVKLAVRGAGWIRVGQPALVAAGLDPTVDPARLQLYADGVERAIVVTGNGDHAFTADEAIELWGTGRDTAWTDTRTYWLVAGSAGARVANGTPGSGAAAPPSFTFTQSLVERTAYGAAIRNGDVSNFVGAVVTSTPAMRTLTARHLDAASADSAVLRVALQGVTATLHTIDVQFNGAMVGTCTLDSQSNGTFSFFVPNVVEGDNTVTMTAEAANDYTGTMSLALDYPHAYAADGDVLAFDAPAGVRVAVGGFTTSDVRVVDITDETRPIELPVTVSAQAGANAATVDVPASPGTHRLYAFTAAHVGAAAAVTADAPSSWAASHDGELLVISHAAFLGALAPLVARRAQEGWSVQLVDVQDVYDEEGFGDKSADAIRTFIQRARATWRVPPRFVLLVGDATFDPRNFLGQGDFDFMPTRLIDTASMETASDDWFVDDDLDGVPELAIGRLPVRTSAQANTIVGKLLGYAGVADLPRGGLFVTDTDDVDLDFSGASAAAEAKVSDIMPVDRFHRVTSGTPDVLLAKLNAGPFLVNYIGHGSVEVWDGLLTTSQAAALTNDHASIYVVMNCLNGFFHDLYTTSIAESLLTAPQGGAVAVWASSTLADFGPQPAFNQEFLMRLSRTSLGEAAIAAKSRITDLETRRTWLLFGDPTMFGAPSPVQPPPGDAGADGGATTDASVGVDAGANGDAAADAGGMIDAGSPDVGTAPDAGVDATPEMDATPPMDATATSDAGMDATHPPADASGAADAGGDGARAPAPGGGCSCDEGGGTGFGPASLGVSLLGLVLGARRGRRRRAAARGARHLAAAAVLLVGLAWSARADAAYLFRMSITIDHTRIGTTTGATTLTNYPLLLDITSSPNLKNTGVNHRVQSANGYDISFQSADSAICGASPTPCALNYEIESYNGNTGRVIAWVNIPVLNTAANTSDTVIYVMYDDAAITTPTQNANGTWNSNFKGVWHLNQGSGAAQTDSTTTPANVALNGAPAPANATGLISAGIATSSTTGNGYLAHGSTKFNWTASDTFTYQGWFKTTDGAGPLFSDRESSTGNADIDITLGYNGVTTNTNKMSVLVRDDTGVSYAEVNGSTALNDNAWHHFAVTRSGSTITVYVDGASIGSGSNAGVAGSITTTTSLQNIGREGYWVTVATNGTTDQQYLAATFDEFRISNTARSAEWIKTDYNTQSTPASTYTLGTQTGSACGDGTKGGTEGCDDGDILSGDGCSSTCTVESGYTCTGTTPSVCTTTCGDGIVAGSEACDDGAKVNGDGCSSTCTVEATYHCSGSPSTCTVALFNFYKVVTVDRTKVGTAAAPTTISDYPVLFSVIDSSLATTGRVKSASGFDIIFRGLDSVTCGGPSVCTLPHQVEKYVAATGEIVAWVNVGGLKSQTNSANTQFRVMFGNPAITTSTERVTSTWNSGFTGVWHLNQTPSGAGSMDDATSNANDGTPTSVSALAGGKMGAGVTMNGTASYIAMNSGSALNTSTGGAFTYSVWVNTSDTLGALFSLRSSTDGNPVIDIMLGMDGATTNAGHLMALLRDSSGAGLGEVVSGSTTFNNGTWHLVTVNHSGTSMELFLDATSQGTATTSSGAWNTDTRNLGREGRWVQDNFTTPTTNIFTAGNFDEARASNVARDIDWVTTDYNNQNSPTTFITGYITGTAGEVATNSSTAVDLLSLDATASCAGTTIAWQMAQSFDTLGFNVFREENGARVKLNSALIAASSLSGGAGDRYSFVDPTGPAAGRTYWVENVTFALDSRWYGPAAPAAAPDCNSVSVPGGPGGAPLPTVTPAAVAPGETAGDQMGGCAVAAGPAAGVLPLALVAAALALARARRGRRR